MLPNDANFQTLKAGSDAGVLLIGVQRSELREIGDRGSWKGNKQ